MTINQLPDEILLEIFSFYMALSDGGLEDAWHTLVHVCQQWRNVVFGSPRRLDLRLLCMNLNGTLTKSLDTWPELPIVVHVYYGRIGSPPSVADVISVVKRNDRVCQISIDNAPNMLLKEVAAISEPFPALIELEISSFEADSPILPDSFLGGSVPNLRSFNLWGIPFPAIGKLLSSTRDLVTLYLGSIPPSGYISPEAMVNMLSPLTRLKAIHLNFLDCPHFVIHGASQRPSVLARVILPALATFSFSGLDRSYLEEVVSQIDAPLDCIDVTLFNQPVFDIPLLRDFISRTKIFNAPHRADTSFSNGNASISLFRQKRDIDFKVLELTIFYDDNSHLSSRLRSCSSFLLPLLSLERLSIYDLPSGRWQEVENTHWMELLRPFIAVKDLVLNEPTILSIASVLQELVEDQVADILPALQNIFLEGFESSGPVPEGIGKFIAARELSGRTVIVHYRETKEETYQIHSEVGDL